MRKFGSITCAVRVCVSCKRARSDSTNTRSFPGPDPAITALSVMGVVSELKADTRQVIVTTAAGNQVTVTLSDRTVFMRIPPGEKTKDKFIKISSDRFRRGRQCLCARADV